MKTIARVAWTCGFCNTGNHTGCTGAAVTGGKILTCGCGQHEARRRCLECGNTNTDELTGWACTNPTDCRDAIAARSAANPLREELEIVRNLGGEARRRALMERTERMVRAAVAAAGSTTDVNGKPLDLQADCAADLARPRKRPVARPTAGVCICGCSGATKGGRFLPGHDAKLKGRLAKAVTAGDEAAYARMVELGWQRYATAAVEKRAKLATKAG